MAGIRRLQLGELTIQKKKGKALTKAVGETFAPEKTLEVNRKIGRGNPSGGIKIGGKK